LYLFTADTNICAKKAVVVNKDSKSLRPIYLSNYNMQRSQSNPCNLWIKREN